MCWFLSSRRTGERLERIFYCCIYFLFNIYHPIIFFLIVDDLAKRKNIFYGRMVHSLFDQFSQQKVNVVICPSCRILITHILFINSVVMLFPPFIQFIIIILILGASTACGLRHHRMGGCERCFQFKSASKNHTLASTPCRTCWHRVLQMYDTSDTVFENENQSGI